MKVQQKRNKIIHKIICLKIFLKGKRNFLVFWIRPGQTSPSWDYFFRRLEKSLRNGKKTSADFEELWTEVRSYIQKNKTRFLDLILVEKEVAAMLYYLVDEWRMRKMANSFGIAKSTVSKIIWSILFLL